MSSPQTPIVTPLPCFLDNYIWHIETVKGDWVVDPGDADVVLAHQTNRGKPLAGVLITHHHLDHTAGIAALVKAFAMPVYGPAEVGKGVSNYISANDVLTLDGMGSVRGCPRLCVTGLPSDTVASDRRHHEQGQTPHQRRAA